MTPEDKSTEIKRTFGRRGRELRLAARPLLILTRFGTPKHTQTHPHDYLKTEEAESGRVNRGHHGYG